MSNKEKVWIRFSDRVVSAFRKSADEIERFSLEAKLGSMDIRDVLKKIVSDFKKNVDDVMNRYHNLTVSQKLELKNIKEKLNQLWFKLVSGGNDAKVIIEEQIKNLILLFRKFESVTGKIIFPDSLRNYLEFEWMKLKNKLRVIRLKLAAEKSKAKYLFRRRKRELYQRLKLA